MLKNKKLLILAIVIFLILLALKIFLVFQTPLGFNEATYYSMAKAIPEGKILYLDTFDHKPPLVYYLLALFLEIFGFAITLMHLLTLLLDLSLAVIVFFLVRKFFKPRLAFLASLIAFSLITNVFYDAEISMAILGILGFIFYLKSFESRKALFLFLSGVFLALSVWFKQPGILFFLAILIHQIFLIKNKDRKIKDSIRELYFIIAGAIVISLPILSYFIYKVGLDNLFFHIITFNAKFSGSTSRILQTGKLVEMLFFNLGVFLAIIIFNLKSLLKEKAPRKNLLFITFSVLSIVFFLLNKEVFYQHLYMIIPAIAFLTAASISLEKEKTKTLIVIILLFFILGFFFFNLENAARNYRSGILNQNDVIVQNITSQIQNSSIFADSPIYYVLLNKQCEYRFCYIAPSVASVFSFEDFCDFAKSQDYLILTHRKKYLGENNLGCIEKNFVLIKNLDNIGESFVEIWRKNGIK